MYWLEMTVKGNCIIVTLDQEVSELKALAESLNLHIKKVFIQKRNSPDQKYFVGKGKVEEIKDFIEKNEVDIVIINTSLKPSQQYNLENYLKTTIYDRIRLILEIFTDRAHSQEAKLQVELAKLQYETPLLRDWIHKARYGERPGFMAGGEYEVAQYYEISRKRIKKIKEKLRKIEKERDLRRKKRRKLGYHLISIVGYTNAGKSTLFNLISGETVAVENKLFTTLSTTTRKIPRLEKPILITDTVGLIDNLPHWIIEAFHSTLEEVFLSDIILLIIDIGEPTNNINRKLKTSFDVLLPDLEPSKIILIFNKIDKINHIDNRQTITDEINLEHKIKDIIVISATDEIYKEKVIEIILEALHYPNNLLISIPNNPISQKFVSWLHKNSDIVTIKYGGQIKIDLRCRERDKGYILKKCKELKGKILKDEYI